MAKTQKCKGKHIPWNRIENIPDWKEPFTLTFSINCKKSDWAIIVDCDCHTDPKSLLYHRRDDFLTGQRGSWLHIRVIFAWGHILYFVFFSKDYAIVLGFDGITTHCTIICVVFACVTKCIIFHFDCTSEVVSIREGIKMEKQLWGIFYRGEGVTPAM